MQFSVTFRHMEPSDPLKDFAKDKLAKLEKYLDAVLDAEVVMTIEKFRHKAEVLINSDGLKIKAEEETDDMYSSIDMVVDKLEKQIKRHREKLKAHNKPNGKKAAKESQEVFASEDDFEDGPDLPGVDVIKKYQPKIMSLAEASEALAKGVENIVIFLNSEDEHLCVLHQLKDGRLELVRINH